MRGRKIKCTQEDVQEVATLVQEVIDPACTVIFGNSIDEDMHDEIEVTIIATGFPEADSAEDKIAEEINEFNPNFAEEPAKDRLGLKGLGALKNKEEEEEKKEARPERKEVVDESIPAWLKQLRSKKK